MNCNICHSPLAAPVYESSRSLTSLCEVSEEETRVRFCAHCGHLQTDELADAASFYDEEYEILTNSEEEDQIYEVQDGRKVFRTEHQVNVLLKKLDLPDGAAILDFGCAKSSMMRSLTEKRSNIRVHLYDISDRYQVFWEKFVPAENTATYEVPGEWQNKFEVVTSFFSLEHITEPAAIVRQIAGLLKPGGVFYGIVPNVLTNTADFLVIDHVNHFTESSLDYVLRSAGFYAVTVDTDAHRGALVFSATRPCTSIDDSGQATVGTGASLRERIHAIAAFWNDAAAAIAEQEASLPEGAVTAMYGAGFYGSFIRAALREPALIRYVVDQNPYLQGKTLGGAPVVAPGDLPDEVSHLFVGLNPKHARDIIAAIPAFSQRKLGFLYL